MRLRLNAELISKISLEGIQSKFGQFSQQIVEWAQDPQFYAQCGLIAAAIIFAFLAAKVVGKNSKPRVQPSQQGTMSRWRGFLFRLKGVDDGVNRVDADLKMMIWKALKENDISFPFPQREVRILNPS